MRTSDGKNLSLTFGSHGYGLVGDDRGKQCITSFVCCGNKREKKTLHKRTNSYLMKNYISSSQLSRRDRLEKIDVQVLSELDLGIQARIFESQAKAGAD